MSFRLERERGGFCKAYYRDGSSLGYCGSTSTSR